MIKTLGPTDRRQRGFTLAEILVTTAIFAVIMIAALTVYDRSNKVFKQSTEQADMQQSTRIAFDKLVADLRMAGFDYNRGGPPSGDGESPQPDEQIEYAGPTAVVFRTNLNYNSAAVDCAKAKAGEPCGNGLEPAFTPKNTEGKPIFPWVTTGNDEVLIYVMRSADTSKNKDHISFYLDSSKPRAAFPDSKLQKSPTKGREQKIVVDGIDNSNANPPYTLYRMTLQDVVDGKTGTPVADNIRSLHFLYYSDLRGSQILQDPPDPGTTAAKDIKQGRNAENEPFDATYKDANGNDVLTGAIGGDGMYDANEGSPATAITNYQDRTTRTFIQSIRVDLVGMNSQPDANYTEPTETIGTVKNYRQYHLGALIAPRNLGLTGFPEPAYHVPEPPTITGICTAHCAAPVICWKPSNSGSPILQFEIEWDTNPLGNFNAYKFVVTDPAAVTTIVPDLYNIDPSVTWYYRIRAVNENGGSEPSNLVSGQPKNGTKPLPPSGVAATTGQYSLGVQWIGPGQNDPTASKSNCTGTSCMTDPVIIPSVEQVRYNVYRSTQSTYDPAKAVKVLSYTTAQGVVGPNGKGTFLDSPTTSSFPPGACVDYYYWVQAVDRCYNGGNPSWNSSNDAETSRSVLDKGTESKATAKATDLPSAQATAPITVSVNTTTSACPGPTNTNCKIELHWSKVTTDNAGNAIGVDKYRINRYRKATSDTTFSPDTSFDIAGFSSVGGGENTYTDDTAPAAAPISGETYTYQYTIAANDCRLGAASNPVQFPSPCAATPTIVSAGASNGADTTAGSTPQNPWIFNQGDTITVTAGGSETIARVDLDILTYPSGQPLGTTTSISKPNPFVFSWKDAGTTSGQTYYIKITVTYDKGCKETHVRYVQEYTPAGCAFPPQTASFSSANNVSKGSKDTVNQNFTITNNTSNGTDSMRINGHKLTITWTNPNGATDMEMTEVDVQSGSGSVVKFTPTSGAIGTKTSVSESFDLGSNLADVAFGGSLSIRMFWTYKSTNNPDNTLKATPLQKICLAYQLWDPKTNKADANDTAEKFCAIVGANTKNPTACD